MPPDATDNVDPSSGDLSILAATAVSHEQSGLPQPDAAPTLFGKYTLLRSLGRGGFGEVFLAYSDATWIPAAIKVLSNRRRNDKAAIQRFELEIRVGRELKHPNILPIMDEGEVNGLRYFATPFIDGEDLLHLLAKKPMPGADAAALLRPVAEAVHFAHSKGYLHRDIKPDNILIERSTGKPFVADFGLARNTDTPLGISGTFDVVGTQQYMPPEQADPTLGEVSAATDVYALGATLYQMLTGRTPFPRADKPGRDLLTQITWDRPLPPSAFNADVHPDLDRVCLVCLQKTPFDRYQSAAELAADLRRFEGGQRVEAKVPGRVKLAYRSCQRHRWVTLGVLASILLTIVGALAAGKYATEARESGRKLAGVESTVASALDAEAEARSSERSQVYVADMHDARRDGKDHHYDQVRTLLDKYASPVGEDFRGIEWYYWRQRVGEHARRLPLKTTPEALALSPDANRIALASGTQVIVLDSSTGAPKFTGMLARSAGAANDGGETVAGSQGVAFDPSGRLIAATCLVGSAGNKIGILRVWDTGSGNQLLAVEDEGIYGRAVTFSPDGESVIVAGGRSLWRAWSIRTGQPQGRGRAGGPSKALWTGPEPCYLRFIDDSTLVTVRAVMTNVWQWPESRDADESVGIDPSVAAPANSAKGRRAAIHDDELRRTALNDAIRRGMPVSGQLSRSTYVTSATDVAEGYVAAICSDPVVRVWSLDQHGRPFGTPRELRDVPDTRSRDLIAIRSKTVAVSDHHALLLWNIDAPVAAEEPPPSDDEGMGYFDFASRSGKLRANPNLRQQTLVVRDTREKAVVASLDIGIAMPLGCVFSEDDRFMLVGLNNYAPVRPAPKKDTVRPPRLELWDLDGPKLITSISEEGLPASGSGAFDLKRGVAYLVFGTARVRVVQLSGGQSEDIVTPFVATAATLSPTGRLLAVSGEGCGLFDLQSRQWLWTLHTPCVDMVFHRRDKYVVARTPPRVQAFYCQSGEPMPTLFEKEQDLERSVFSQDYRRLFSLSTSRIRMYAVDEDPGTLLLDITDVPVPDGDKGDTAFVRNLERQLIGGSTGHGASPPDSGGK